MAPENDEFRPGSASSAVTAGAHPELKARILDGLGDAVIATDPTGRIIYWNEAARDLYGWSAEEVIGENILDVTPGEVLRDKAATILETVQRGEAWRGEFLVQDRRGNRFVVSLIDTPVMDESGELIAIVGVSRNTSRQRETEVALQESGARLELVRRVAQSVIWEYDAETDALQWSDALADEFGYETDGLDLSLDWWWERVHPEDRHRVEPALRALLDGERKFWTDEYRFRRADGSYANVFDRAYASARAEGGIRIAGAMVDLTERRRLQDERRLLAQASMILDLSLDYEATLPTLVRLVTNSLADFCVLHLLPHGQRPAFTTCAHRDPGRQADLDRVAAELPAWPRAGSVTERAVRAGEPALLDQLGDDPPDHGTLAPMVMEMGADAIAVQAIRARSRALGYMVLGSAGAGAADLGEAAQVADDLARRIGTAVDHARLYESARLASQAKDDFLAIVSHELRTPITAVLGYADLLGQEISGPLNARQKQQIQRIHAGTDRLHRILESILAYVRLESGQDRPRLARVEVDELLEPVRELIQPRARDDGVGFRIVRDGPPDRVVTDPDWVIHILLALLTNALKFTKAGEVELRVGRNDGFLEFDVRDSGHGIPEEHRPYVFNAFWQAEQPATRRAGGAGLGLSVARRLARLLGGDVTIADSSPGGTTFRFHAPIQPTA